MWESSGPCLLLRGGVVSRGGRLVLLLSLHLGLMGYEGLHLGLMRLLHWLWVLVGRRLVRCLQWRWDCLLWVLLQVWSVWRRHGGLLSKVLIRWLSCLQMILLILTQCRSGL